MAEAVRVWDLPTRLFHWLLVVLFAFSWWSAENREMDWHRWSGLGVLGLLAFRLIWGIMGSSTARFGNFVRSPASVIAYLRGTSGGKHEPGHNPLGGYSVVAMLLLLSLQVTAGLFAGDTDGLESGYLSHLVTFEQSRTAAEIHEIGFNLMLAVIGLHIAAILFYRFKRGRNLVTPMITGNDRQLDSDAAPIIAASPFSFVLAVAISAGMAWWVSAGLRF